MSPDEMRVARNKRKDAERRKRNTLARLRGEPTGLIDSAPIRARAKALNELGWSLEAIVYLGGAQGTASGLRLVVAGHSRACERKFAPIASLPLTLAVPDVVPDTCLVPSLGATRRIRALNAIGWRHGDISEFIGRASHHLASGRYPRMPALDWRIVSLTYDRLSPVTGGSLKTQTRARKAGHAPPLAWDDIDNPGELPIFGGSEVDVDEVVVRRLLEGQRVKATKAEKEAAMARWVADGGSRAELARWHGWNAERYLRLVQGGAA